MHTTEEMINQVICNLNSITVAGVENMSLIISSIQMLSSVKEGIREHEKTHKEQLDKMMDRIKEISESKDIKVVTANVSQNKGGDLPSRVG